MKKEGLSLLAHAPHLITPLQFSGNPQHFLLIPLKSLT